MIAFVFGVTNSNALSISNIGLSFNVSANITFAPNNLGACPVAIKVKSGIIDPDQQEDRAGFTQSG